MVWYFSAVLHPKDADGTANSVDPDPTALEGQSDMGLQCFLIPVLIFQKIMVVPFFRVLMTVPTKPKRSGFPLQSGVTRTRVQPGSKVKLSFFAPRSSVVMVLLSFSTTGWLLFSSSLIMFVSLLKVSMIAFCVKR